MHQDPWWWQTVTRKQPSANLKVILAAERGRCWKSRRSGEGGGYMGAAETDDGTGSNGSQYDGTGTGDT